MLKHWIAGSLLALGSLTLASLVFNPAPLVFQSRESITEKGEAVFNRIYFKPGWTQDTWLMQQSHQGFHLGLEKWDRLAIVVDKSKKPYQARFYQFTAGRFSKEVLDAHDPVSILKDHEAPYKARCFACHSNGPRAIRPAESRNFAQLSIYNQLRVGFWNLRVKTYGQVDSRPGLGGIEGNEGKLGFRSPLPIFQQNLQLKSCTRCHSENGIRQPLKLEHLGTASFLVKEGLMPPFPFKASTEDVAYLMSASGGP